jgi:threonine dehydratase
MAVAIQTPLVRLSNLFPRKEVYAKCEFLAPSGCFKIRGATHLLNHLSRQGTGRKLIVPSMGNTALGAAQGAREFGFSMVGIVPQSISRAKDERLQALGVELIKIPGRGSELLRVATRIADEQNGYFVHPHLDPLWTDGYQAIAEEIMNTLPGCKSLVFPVGGGGLLMGVTEYLLKHPASVELYGCEAYNYPTYTPFTHERSSTLADGLVLDDPHLRVQERIASFGIELHLVKDPDIPPAMKDLYYKQGCVVEPSSAVTTAFVAQNLSSLSEPVCVILTGQNITWDDFSRLIADT